ncbi:DUF3122 domain-containing protein [Trichothermofontia sichuanensis B231]|uniref:DUF3122 domain-containing protein n=1 Tax=Trichothermofontia sichuanensis TaxID=3045816 RepID=UPI0022473D1D|nr:DUF3122 domain-containing protein [Trichothermofontia sichuanensis]UZQ54037.1 DUF3122 domain-containing protein [Trichothermofontia sichuanensis B231]
MSPLTTLRSSIFTGVSSWIAQGVVICRQGCFSIGLALVILLTGAIVPPPALAVLRQVEEAPGQVVYQSRQSVRDRDGHTWQVIAFERLKPNGERSVYLRLVGFPGIADIDRSQPLTLTTSLGQVLTADDASGQIFTDASRPEPNVSQYDLEPIVAKLPAGLPLSLSLAMTDGNTVVLNIPPALVQEWQAVLNPPPSEV